MTVKTNDDTVQLAQNLELRNKEVEKAFVLITQASKQLLTTFEHAKYRTIIESNKNHVFTDAFGSDPALHTGLPSYLCCG